MKAWNELMVDNDISLYWTGDHRNPTSYWYMDHGIKIEMFNDTGEIKINNVMTPGDHYEEITEDQYAIFNNDGWLAGCYNVNISTLDDKMKRLQVYVNSCKEEDALKKLMDRKELLIKKQLRYFDLLDKL